MGRRELGLVAATCLLVCSTAGAQGWPPAPPPFADPYLNYAPVPGEAAYQSASPILHGQHAGPVASTSPEIMRHLIPADRGFLYDHDSRFDLMLKEWVRGSWITIEYLNWEISHPGRTLMGSTTTLTRNPAVPFTVPTNDPLGLVTLQAITGDTDQADWSDINGIRGSFGIPITTQAWVEASFWGLSSATDSFQVARLPASVTVSDPNPVRLVVTPLLTNGVPGTTLIAYDNSFTNFYKTDVWSADASLVFNHSEEDYGWTTQSIWGFKYLEYSEQFGFSGSFTNVSGYDQLNPAVIAPVSNRLFSDVSNSLYGMQLGFRTEMRHKYFTLGVEPKLILAANRQEASVTTDNLRNPGNISGVPIDDPLMTTTFQTTGFSPGLELNTYAKVHLTEWLNLKVGYGLVWLDRLGTADKNIRYNDNGAANPPDVTVRRSLTNRFIDGLTVGAEILLP